MEFEVTRFQEAYYNTENELNKIEEGLSRRCPNAEPLLQICRRLRAAKERISNLKADFQELTEAQMILNQIISEHYNPLQQLLQERYSTFESQNKSQQNIEYSTNRLKSSSDNAEGKYQNNLQLTDKKTTKHRKSVQEIILPEYSPITEEETESLDTRTFGKLHLQELQNLYQFIYNYYQSHGSGIITKHIMTKHLKVVHLIPDLRALKYLKRIELTLDEDVKCLV